MRLVIQRVSEASVKIEDKISGKIGKGFLVLVGITDTDTKAEAEYLAEKCCGLRIFEDADGKMNVSLKDAGGELLVISNFTLYGNCDKGKRPSFIFAAGGQIAEPLYDYFVECCKNYGVHVETGEFGADMKVSLTNDGPITLIIDSK